MNNDLFWQNVNLSENDIIISSTIKSGTTWLQQIVAQLVFKGNFNGKLNETSYWVDTIREYSEKEMIAKINSQEHRRFYKTHSPASVVLTNKNKKQSLYLLQEILEMLYGPFIIILLIQSIN